MQSRSRQSLPPTILLPPDMRVCQTLRQEVMSESEQHHQICIAIVTLLWESTQSLTEESQDLRRYLRAKCLRRKQPENPFSDGWLSNSRSYPAWKNTRKYPRCPRGYIGYIGLATICSDFCWQFSNSLSPQYLCARAHNCNGGLPVPIALLSSP